MLQKLFAGKPVDPFYFPNIQKSFSLANSGSLITSTARIMSALVLLPFNTLRDAAHHTAQAGNRLIGRSTESKNPLMKNFESTAQTAKATMLKAAKISAQFAIDNKPIVIRTALTVSAVVAASALGYYALPGVSKAAEGTVNAASAAGEEVGQATTAAASEVAGQAIIEQPVCVYNPFAEVAVKTAPAVGETANAVVHTSEVGTLASAVNEIVVNTAGANESDIPSNFFSNLSNSLNMFAQLNSTENMQSLVTGEPVSILNTSASALKKVAADIISTADTTKEVLPIKIPQLLAPVAVLISSLFPIASCFKFFNCSKSWSGSEAQGGITIRKGYPPAALKPQDDDVSDSEASSSASSYGWNSEEEDPQQQHHHSLRARGHSDGSIQLGVAQAASQNLKRRASMPARSSDPVEVRKKDMRGLQSHLDRERYGGPLSSGKRLGFSDTRLVENHDAFPSPAAEELQEAAVVPDAQAQVQQQDPQVVVVPDDQAQVQQDPQVAIIAGDQVQVQQDPQVAVIAGDQAQVQQEPQAAAASAAAMLQADHESSLIDRIGLDSYAKSLRVAPRCMPKNSSKGLSLHDALKLQAARKIIAERKDREARKAQQQNGNS